MGVTLLIWRKCLDLVNKICFTNLSRLSRNVCHHVTTDSQKQPKWQKIAQSGHTCRGGQHGYIRKHYPLKPYFTAGHAPPPQNNCQRIHQKALDLYRPRLLLQTGTPGTNAMKYLQACFSSFGIPVHFLKFTFSNYGIRKVSIYRCLYQKI